MTIIEKIAYTLDAKSRCEKEGGSFEWAPKPRLALLYLADNHCPSGSGLDQGTRIDCDKSTPDRIVFTTSFHHMNEHGVYDGWTEHTVIVKPTFLGKLDIRVTGRDRNGVKDYLAELFYYSLLETWKEPTANYSLLETWKEPTAKVKNA